MQNVNPDILKKEISQAWTARLAQRIEECRMSVAGLKMALHLPAGFRQTTTVGEALAGLKHPELVLQTLLLVASLQRAEGQRQESLELIDDLFVQARRLDIEIPFELPFQKGLGYFALGDYTSALDSFLSARSLARDASQTLLALANAVFCLDYLGLPFERTLAEARKIAGEVTAAPAGTRLEIGAEITSQFVSRLETLRILECLRAGRIDEIFGADTSTAAAGFDEYPQNTYLRSWVKGLPYHAAHGDDQEAELEKLSLSSPHFFKKPYRLRTLQGLLHPDDSVEQNESEFCDRLYLWTWRWLKDPTRFPLQKIMVLLRKVELGEMASRLTMDDYQKLRNALHWLGLFDPKTYHRLEGVIQVARPHGGREHELFRFEYELLSYLNARRDQKHVEAADYLKVLAAHPLWDSASLLIGQLADSLDDVTALAGTPLEKLAETLRQLAVAPQTAQAAELVVDLTTSQIRHVPSDKTQISEPMAKAIDLLHRTGQIGCSEFLAFCFGIDGYDSLVHDPKIFNLLARMRKILPAALRIGVKSGQVFAMGGWQQLRINGLPNESASVRSQAEWKTFLLATPKAQVDNASSMRWVQPQLLLKKLAGKNEFSREEIEALTGASRSTANRLITAWMKKGWIKRRGKARRTVYLLSNSLDKDSTEKGPLHETSP